MKKYKEKFVSVGDADISYEVGNGSNPVVFMHGYGINHTLFNNVRAQLPEEFGSVSVDLRGHGKSTYLKNATDFSIEKCTSDLEKILDAESAENPVIVGHSMGSMIAQNFAARHPTEVKGLVLISGSYNFAESFGSNPISRLALKLSPLRKSLYGSLNAVVGPFVRENNDFFEDFSNQKFRDMSNARLFFEMYCKTSPEFVKSICAVGEAIMEWDTTKIAPNISAPTLLIHGEQDKVVSPKTSYELYKMIPNARKPIIVPNTDHNIVLRNPEAVNEYIQRFLQEIKS